MSFFSKKHWKYLIFFWEQKSILFYPFFILCRNPGTENVTPTFFTLHWKMMVANIFLLYPEQPNGCSINFQPSIQNWIENWRLHNGITINYDTKIGAIHSTLESQRSCRYCDRKTVADCKGAGLHFTMCGLWENVSLLFAGNLLYSN